MEPIMDHVPDPRLVERLVAQLRAARPAPASWVAAGESLAIALLAAGRGPLPPWSERLADAMVGSLLSVQDETMDDAEPVLRVRLGLAAAVLSVVRPRAVGACDAALSTWIGWSAGSPRALEDHDLLAGWVLLGLLLRDADRAAEAVDALIDHQPAGLGFLLHDWTVAVLQDHGFARQAQSFHNLRTAMRVDGKDRPTLLVVAAVVLVEAAGLPRARVTGWLDEVVQELARDGIARSTPLAALRRG